MIQDTIFVQVALNGQDFIEIPVPIKLTGINNNENETPLYALVLLGAVVLMIVAYILRKALALSATNGKESLVSGMARSDSQNVTEISTGNIFKIRSC